MCASCFFFLSIVAARLSMISTQFNDRHVAFSLNWQEFKHDPKPPEAESMTMRTNSDEFYNCQLPTKLIEQFDASDTLAVDEAALEDARWLLLPLLNTETSVDGTDDTCRQVHARASLPGEFWLQRRDVVYELCGLAGGGQVRLFRQEGGNVWHIGGFPEGSGVADMAATLRPGPPGSFVEVDENCRSAFVELALDAGGDSCSGDLGGAASKSDTVSTILRFACGLRPRLASAEQLGPCRHRLLLLTPLLCGNAAFRPRPARINHIACRRVRPLAAGSGSAASGPPRSLALLEVSRDSGRLLNLLTLLGGEPSVKKLRLGVGNGPAETVFVYNSDSQPWILDSDEEN